MAASFSPAVTVTEAGAEFAQPVASPASLPSTGGAVVISGTTSDPDGTTYYLYANGVDTGVSTTSSGGAFTFPAYTVAPNTSISPVTISFTVSTTP
jgi:hypothetical protein